MAKKVKTGKIDLTPKWINLIPLFVQWICDGGANKQIAVESLEQMAKVCDKFAEHKKHGGLICKCGDSFDLSPDKATKN